VVKVEVAYNGTTTVTYPDAASVTAQAAVFENDYEAPVYDAALRKWVSAVNGVNTAADVAASETAANGGQPSAPVAVLPGELVTYAIRVFNQGAYPLQVAEITDYLPGYLEWDRSVSNPGWSLVQSANGSADPTAPSDANNAKLKYAWNGGTIPTLYPNENSDGTYSEGSYATVYVTLRVKDPGTIPAAGIPVTNHAEISKLTDEDGTEVKDTDSASDDEFGNDGDTDDNVIDEEQDEDDEDLAIIKILPPVIAVEVDKDTIKLTSAAFVSHPDHFYYNNVGAQDERFKYDIDFRSTSNVATDEFVVDDPLEAVRLGQIYVEELWTPIVWGDTDGTFYVLYQTNKPVGGNPGIDSNPAKKNKLYSNDGYRVWAGTGALSTTARHHLKVSDLRLAANEYVTAIRFDYGAVEVGFTSRNAAKNSLNGEWRTNEGEIVMPSPEDAEKLDLLPDPSQTVSLLQQIKALFAGDDAAAITPLATGISGNTVDWTPSGARPDFAQGAADARGLKPASYLVSATHAMTDETIVTSVSARIARGAAVDLDQDAVVTVEFTTFVADPQEPDVGSIVMQDSFVEHASENGVVLRGGHWYDRSGSRVKVGRGGPAQTGDAMALGAWFVIIVITLVCLILLRVTYGPGGRKRRREAFEKGGEQR
jgi:hypothetical protein